VREKLEGLQRETDETDAAGREGDEADVVSEIGEASDHLRAYMKEHPQGG